MKVKPILLTLSKYLLLACVFAFGLKMIKEPDVWWMLRTGEWIMEHGQVVRQDSFSFTAFGVDWINVKWLFEVLLYQMARTASPAATPVLQLLVYGLCFFILERRVLLIKEEVQEKQVFKWCYLLLGFLCLLAIEFRMLGRPEMMSHLFLLAFAYSYERHRKHSGNFIFALIPLQLLWTNLHEAYGIGLIMILCFIAGAIAERILLQKAWDKKLLLASVLALLAIAINPRGISMLWHPFEILGQVASNKYTVELVNALDPLYWRMSAYFFFGFFVLSLLGFGLQFRGMNYRFRPFLLHYGLVYLVLYAAFFYLGLTAYRNIPFFVLFASPLAAKTLGIVIHRWMSNKVSWTMAVGLSLCGLSLYAGIVSNRYYQSMGRTDQFGLQVNALKNPADLSRFLAALDLKGNAFSDYLVSSYLMWDLRPGFKTFIDMRDLDVFEPDFFNSFFELTGRPAAFEAFDQEYNFQYAVVSRSEMMALQIYLDRHADWEMVYADPVASLFLKRKGQNQKQLDSLNQNLRGSIFQPLKPLSPDLFSAGLSKLFNPFYETRRSFQAHDFDLIAADFFLELRDYDAALYHCRRSLEKKGETEQVMHGEGKVYLTLLGRSLGTEKQAYYEELVQNQYARLQQLYPESDLWRKGAGILAYYRQNHARCIQLLESIQEKSQDFESLSFLSEAYANQMGNNISPGNPMFSDFLERSLQAHELNPNDPILNFKLAMVYCQMNDCSKAKAHLEWLNKFPEKLSEDNRRLLRFCFQKCQNR